MTATRILRSIVEASAPDDGEDVEIRQVLRAELGLTIALCPPVVADDAERAADDRPYLPGFCALAANRRLTPACGGCLLGQMS